MSTWDDYKRTCMHGVREDVDWHTCPECQRIAEKIGLEPNRSGYFFASKKAIKATCKRVGYKGDMSSLTN